jgi:hypothetical protein
MVSHRTGAGRYDRYVAIKTTFVHVVYIVLLIFYIPPGRLVLIWLPSFQYKLEN